ncbi:hypothetical protein M446_2834 [Methylobacterium sp. 4-46]|uniref:hypothetical protein n=1 Tax=unclassified Methylobacterium TaxID=2615210 RepID=UPI000152D818|nr:MULTISPECIES: hypothetical protein [Methylobacterium]ACA17259.1 hypothetical protein M446_2834 [Methylobacterium sp. 4-46]WFT82945.1 hypothetical protein QA634_14370 [Methylobacterium nodulans]
MIPSRSILARALAVAALATTLVGYTALQARAGTPAGADLGQLAQVSATSRTVLSDALADNCYYVEEQVIGRSGKSRTRRTQECD